MTNQIFIDGFIGGYGITIVMTIILFSLIFVYDKIKKIVTNWNKKWQIVNEYLN